MARFVIVFVNRYGEIKSKFSTYNSVDLAEANLDEARDWCRRYRAHLTACVMSEADYDRRLARAERPE